MVVIFFKVSRRELQKRIDILLAAGGIRPGMPQHELQERIDTLLAEGILPEMPQHKFWYFCRNLFLKENPDLKKIDSKAKDVHANWSGTILPMWFVSKGAKQLGLDLHYPDGGPYRPNMSSTEKKDCMWDLVRYALNIVPKPTAVCYGAGKPFLISRHTAKDVTKDRSLILVCEKSTIAEKLQAELEAAGFDVNTVGTGGCTPMEAQRVVINAAKKMIEKRVNFWILVLHDYDIAGVQIYSRLKRWGGECIIDVGVNREFLDYLKSEYELDMKLHEEQVLVKLNAGALREWIAEGGRGYSLEDYKYLQGKPFPFKTKDGKITTHYNAMRIEIDPIEVEHTIEPYIKFILAKIESACRVWDLRRIGVKDFPLEEPADLYEKTAHAWMQPIREVYKNTYNHLCQPELSVMSIVKKVLSTQMEDLNERFQQILDEHWEHTHPAGYGIGYGELNRLKGLDELKEDFSDVWNIEWITREDYVDALANVNEQIEFYEGDVREGEDELQEQVEAIQKQIHDDQQDEYDGSDFVDRLEDVDWGEEELEAIERPDEKAMLKQVIKACRTRIKEIDNE